LSSLAFAYSTFDLDHFGGGTQYANGGDRFMPLIVAGFYCSFKNILGSYLTTSIALQSSVTQHVQIIYYTGIILGFITIAFIVKSWKENKLNDISCNYQGLPAIVGFAAMQLHFTRQNMPKRMRGGKSE
jgi:hypothetical protein